LIVWFKSRKDIGFWDSELIADELTHSVELSQKSEMSMYNASTRSSYDRFASDDCGGDED
jgi:hypothetical protein